MQRKQSEYQSNVHEEIPPNPPRPLVHPVLLVVLLVVVVDHSQYLPPFLKRRPEEKEQKDVLEEETEDEQEIANEIENDPSWRQKRKTLNE